MVYFIVLLILFGFSFATEFDGYLVKLKDGLISSQSIKGNSNIILVKDEKELEKYLNDENVEYIEPNYKLHKVGSLPRLVPNDEFFDYQWALEKIRAPESWYELDNTDTSSNQTVYIAVLDTGVDYTHPDLRGSIWLNIDETTGTDNNGNGIDDGCENNVDDDNNGYTDDCYGWDATSAKGSAFDEDGHGTHIAGIIAAITNNNQGIAGATWKTDIKIIPCKMLDSSGQGEILDELLCLSYIKDLKDKKGLNIAVVNASYGGEYNSDIEKDAINTLKNKGILFITASGNSGNSNEKEDFSPCNYDLPHEICVGATDQNDERATFSNYGFNKVKVYAPGKEIISTYNKDENDNYSYTYAWIDGTSQATPFVSSIAGMLAFLNPSYSYSDIRYRILTTGKNLSSLDGFSYTCNRIDMYNALFSTTTEPKLCLSKNVIDFKKVSQEEGDVYKTVIVRSTGNEDLVVYSIYAQNDNYKIKNNTCDGKHLSAFEECTFEVHVDFDKFLTSPLDDNIVVSTNAGDRTIFATAILNIPPKILDLEVSPSNPDPDERVYLRWEIENTDGDKLTCKVDIDNDGDYEKVINDCPETGSISFKYSEEKKYKIIFVVSDGYYETEESISVRVGDTGDGSTKLGCVFSGRTDGAFFLLSLLFGIFLLRRRL